MCYRLVVELLHGRAVSKPVAPERAEPRLFAQIQRAGVSALERRAARHYLVLFTERGAATSYSSRACDRAGRQRLSFAIATQPASRQLGGVGGIARIITDAVFAGLGPQRWRMLIASPACSASCRHDTGRHALSWTWRAGRCGLGQASRAGFRSASRGRAARASCMTEAARSHGAFALLAEYQISG